MWLCGLCRDKDDAQQQMEVSQPTTLLHVQ